MHLNVEPHSLHVGHHIEHVSRGTYALPEFQRTFVWDSDRVLRLWDSLYCGFPIGQLMLWVPREIDFPMRSLGRTQQEVVPKGPESVAVIDGQQRLTALYLVLTADVALRFDLEKKRFTFNSGENNSTLSDYKYLRQIMW